MQPPIFAKRYEMYLDKLFTNVACQQLVYQTVKSQRTFKRQAIKVMIVKRLQISDTSLI